MSAASQYGDVTLELDEQCVATLEIHRAPNNFFDLTLIDSLAQALEELDADLGCRSIVLCSEGKHFCAGANFGGGASGAGAQDASGRHLYDEAVRLFQTRKPVVAAIQGAAVGGGLGLALMADFRVAAPEARFSANFARLGFHHGFALSVTLPDVIGPQRTLELLYTGRRVTGEEALAMGLCDRLVPLDSVRAEAHSLAAEIAISAPLAVESIRATMRGGLAERARAATDWEKIEQDRLRATADFKEGIAAMAERRRPNFVRG